MAFSKEEVDTVNNLLSKWYPLLFPYQLEELKNFPIGTVTNFDLAQFQRRVEIGETLQTLTFNNRLFPLFGYYKVRNCNRYCRIYKTNRYSAICKMLDGLPKTRLIPLDCLQRVSIDNIDLKNDVGYFVDPLIGIGLSLLRSEAKLPDIKPLRIR